MNRGELIFRVGHKLGFDVDEGSDELRELQLWANDAVVETLLKTHAYIKIGQVQLQSGVAEYRLDPSILAIDDGKGVTPAGVGHYQIISLAEMIDFQSTNIVNPTYRKYITIEGDMLIVSPTPGSGETLSFYYVPRPAPMMDDLNDPSDPAFGGIASEYHRALEYYMLWQGAEDDDKDAALKPQDYFQLFTLECKLVRQRKWRKRGRGLLPARAGYPGSHRLPRRNDVYPR